MSMPGAPSLPKIDVNEYGGKNKDGERQAMNRRLFMQVLVFEAPEGVRAEARASATSTRCRARDIKSVVYADANDPRSVGLLTWSDDPSHFVKHVRPIFSHDELLRAKIRGDFTMLGRTYSQGYEPDLEDALLHRFVRNVENPAYPWHVWYPLRRAGAFAKLTPEDQSSILKEHGVIGHAYGQAGLAHDVRLACHGLDAKDNEFVIGLVGQDLHPLSHLVQTMRKTRQTSEFISQMGPFFVGYVLHRT
jgi:chlorite dismutase